MHDSITNYARLGLVHHMLYPDCAEHPEEHVATLTTLAARSDIETFDCCLPYDPIARGVLEPVLRNCGKTDITFATHFFPLRWLSFCDLSPTAQAQAKMIVKDMVTCAAAIGATGFIFASGGPTPAQATPAHHAAFAAFCRWFCGELKPYGITAMLEPFDMTIDKCFLYGPTSACMELIDSLSPGIDNLAIELDMAHLPLMGENFADAIKTVAPRLARVHLGNCVRCDTSHPRYGDTHPPMGFPGGEIDVPELTAILRQLLDVGFLDTRHRGSLILEMTPWPGKCVEDTITDAWARLATAWKKV
ncbi:MAG TPA: sugar phosphate isomerase/epimerase [Armatimonadota bacterium]|nr:sugar phosphate isomerase/epimerase [Armatimonadota bacterium]